MSFFSKTQLDRQENYANKGIIIHTMQDDIDIINGVTHQEQGGAPSKKPPFSLFSSHEDSLSTNNPVSINSSANQNPFIIQEQIIQPKIVIQQPQTPTPTPVQKTQPIQANTTNQNPFNSTPAQKQEIFIDPRNPFALATHHEDITHNSTININSNHTVRNSILFILCILALVGGGYYFYMITRNTPEAVLPIQTPPLNQTTQTTPLFSTETPNYLPIDVNSATPTSFKAILTQTAKQTAGLKSEKPVEFFITDTNNNPLSFTSFAKIAGITLTQSTLAALNDKFSLFIYTNNQSPSIGLSIETKDATALQKALLQNETTLAQSISPLFLSDAPAKITGTFHDGTYRNIPLRFLNINPTTGLSTDYALKGNHLIIGTSMNTHHALLDLIQ